MTLLSDCGMTAVCIKLAPEVNRAFSAGGVRFNKSWGAPPQAPDEMCAFGAEHL